MFLYFPLAAAAAVAAEARARKRRRDKEESALRLGLDQWRHTGSVTGAPLADSESEEASESPGPATHLSYCTGLNALDRGEQG